MEEVKQDGFYYACDELMTRYYECGDCENCPVNVNSTCEVKDGPGEHHEECVNKLKEYYQSQSDVVDGWDVVKQEYKEIKQIVKQQPNHDYYKRYIKVLEDLMFRYGIEVR